MSKLLAKDETKLFSKFETLKDFNSLQEEHYLWITFPTSDGEYIPLENNPICVPILRDTLGVSKDVSDDTIAEQMEDTKICLRFPNHTETLTYPVGPTAYRGILSRLGASCPALNSLSDSKIREEVDPVDKAQICNLLSRYSKGTSLLLVGDEMILADLSSNYVRLPFSEILSETKKILSENYEIIRFVNGIISHESSSVEFMFQDTELDDYLYNTFKKVGIDISDYNAHIKVLTSDVGLSGVNIYPFIKSAKTNKIYSVGSTIKLEHIGDADIEKYRKNLLSCFSMFRNIDSKLDNLRSIVIKNPADCLYNVGQKLNLSDKLLREEYESFDTEFPFSSTGIDIFNRLFDFLDVITESDGINDLKIMQIQENISRICFHNLSFFDKPALI